MEDIRLLKQIEESLNSNPELQGRIMFIINCYKNSIFF